MRRNGAAAIAFILVFSLFYIVFTFLSDVLNAWLDPRMRAG